MTDVRAKRATVHWQQPVDDGGSPVTGYVVERQLADTGRWVPCGEAGPGHTAARVEGLSPGKRYNFRVKAVNAEGESEPLETEEPVTAQNPYTVPDPPRNLTIEDWDNVSVVLRWEHPARDGGRPVTHYVVEQKGKYDLDYCAVLSTPDPGCEAAVAGLREGQVYQWRVRAVNKAGQSEPCHPTDRHTAKHRNRKFILVIVRTFQQSNNARFILITLYNIASLQFC